MNTFLKIDTFSVDSFIYILGVASWKSSTTKLDTKKLWMKWSFKTLHVFYIFLVVQITLNKQNLELDKTSEVIQYSL